MVDHGQQTSTMVFHGWPWFINQLPLSAISDHGWPCLTMVQHSVTTVDLGQPWSVWWPWSFTIKYHEITVDHGQDFTWELTNQRLPFGRKLLEHDGTLDSRGTPRPAFGGKLLEHYSALMRSVCRSGEFTESIWKKYDEWLQSWWAKTKPLIRGWYLADHWSMMVSWSGLRVTQSS